MNYDLVHPVEKVLLKVKFMWCKIEHVIPIVLLDSKLCLSPSTHENELTKLACAKVFGTGKWFKCGIS